ncbi:MAG TPA: hypothetical protein VH877_26740 [Polyangia bacterium]|nr:hypothetical protein [Polyangia bacterium]
MPFANRAHSTKIDELLDNIDKHLENIQYAFIMVTALVVAADDASFYDIGAWKEGSEDNPARDRLCALITMARAKSEELAREIDRAFKVLADRATWFHCWATSGDANAKVDEGLDEATFVLESAGVRPLILLFDEDEAKHFGEKPLARLVALQERARELLKPQTVEATGEASEVLAEALELAKLLAEGEEDRDWTDDDQEGEDAQEGEDDREGQEGEAAEGQDGQKDEASQESEAGQGGEAQDVPDPEDTGGVGRSETGEVVESSAGTVTDADEPRDPGAKPGRRGRKKGGRA